MIHIVHIARRNFFRNLPRYWILIASVAVAVGAMVFVVGVISGAQQVVTQKARRYFAGDITLQEYRRAFVIPEITSPERWTSFAASLDQTVDGYALRSVLYDDTASIFFGGSSARQRRLIGVDWELESVLLSGMQFEQGSVPAPGTSDGVLISTETSRRLGGVQVGDSVILSVRTGTGQFNTATLTVEGVFQESSFFGYASYLDRARLNRLLGAGAERITEVGLVLRSTSDRGRVLSRLRSYLESIGAPYFIAEDREQRNAAVARVGQPGTIIVQSLDSQLAEISDLLDALSAISFAVVIVFLAILSVGVSNTYSMIVFERTREIGTLRAIGMQKNHASLSVLVEALVLGVTSSLLGLLLGLTALEVVARTVDLSRLGFASLFLVDGRVLWYLPGGVVVAIILVAVGSGLFGASGAARQAGRLRPVEALRFD